VERPEYGEEPSETVVRRPRVYWAESLTGEVFLAPSPDYLLAVLVAGIGITFEVPEVNSRATLAELRCRRIAVTAEIARYLQELAVASGIGIDGRWHAPYPEERTLLASPKDQPVKFAIPRLRIGGIPIFTTKDMAIAQRSRRTRFVTANPYALLRTLVEAHVAAAGFGIL
jgi:hypothetical protein